MSAVSPRALYTLFKRGWNEIPEVIGSSVMAIIGIGISLTACSIYHAKDGDNKRYKDKYTVYRHDDPRVGRIRKD